MFQLFSEKGLFLCYKIFFLCFFLLILSHPRVQGKVFRIWIFSVAASVSGPTVAPYFGSGLSVSVTQCCGVGTGGGI